MTDLYAKLESEFFLIDQGLRRRCLVLAANPSDSARVVISLHGSGFAADTYAITSDALHLAACGAVVVLPQAAIQFRLNPAWPFGFAWNIPDSPLPGESLPRHQPDDVAFFHAVLATCAQRYPGLPVHVMGYSGGARLASYVAATAPGLASFGLVAGVRFPKGMTSAPPMLAIHGQVDAINPYAGGNDARWSTGVQTVTRCWALAAGCLGPPQRRDLHPGVYEDRFETADGRSPVRLISLARVGHAWPGSTDAQHITQFGDPGTWSAAQALGRFFSEVDAGKFNL